MYSFASSFFANVHAFVQCVCISMLIGFFFSILSLALDKYRASRHFVCKISKYRQFLALQFLLKQKKTKKRMIIVIHLKYSVVHHCFDIVSESFDFLLLLRLGKIKTNKIQVISLDSQFLYNSAIYIIQIITKFFCFEIF